MNLLNHGSPEILYSQALQVLPCNPWGSVLLVRNAAPPDSAPQKARCEKELLHHPGKQIMLESLGGLEAVFQVPYQAGCCDYH